MVAYIRSDLQFILDQILIAERQAAGESLLDILPNVQVPWGLRTVTGEFNNLLEDQTQFGAADTLFPRLTDPLYRDDADGDTFDANGPAPGGEVTNTDYGAPGSVADADPRIISNLLVDQTAHNPAAYAAAYDPGADGVLNFGAPGNDDVLKDGVQIVQSPGLDGIFGTADDQDVFFLPNITPDGGLAAPFNAWMTFFGQFFDHGLDLVTKGGNETIYIPLQPDDPLYDPGPDGIAGNADDGHTNFMVLTRATQFAGPGADGILGTADDTVEHENTTSPFVDQNQTYTSHPSHQVFLRAYTMGPDGRPHNTGKLIENRDLGADGEFGTADDVETGGMATWKVVKAQARDILGINLTDTDFDNVPLLATDDYGNFIQGPNGFPQVLMKGGDGIAGTADDFLMEGDPAANGGLGIDLTDAVRTGHQFLIDIAHNAVPVFDAEGNLVADADGVAGNQVAIDPLTGQSLEYDDELLDAHYIAGDGRANENIGLTAVHSIFHGEHNRLVDHTKSVLLEPAAGDATALALLNAYLDPDHQLTAFPITPAEIDALVWNGDRLFQAAKFGTEMQYQHLVFEEFARTIQPNIDEFLAPSGYDTTIDASIVAEFAHTVYRFGHSMLTETIDRLDPEFQSSEIGLIAAFLNPLAFAESGPTPEDATSAIIRGVTRQAGNEIDEFVTEALRNNLLGLPLDLAAINIARGRDTGVPTLNAARAQFYEMTSDSQLKPYASWADLAPYLKHSETLINFIAAYGTHEAITSATTLDGMRAAALALVLGDGDDSDGVTIDGITYFDRLDFLNSTGDWANDSALHTVKDLDGVTTTGLGSVDLWIGGLAEEQMPFGGLLGSTFNFVFETQLEALQNGDRFYYLSRTAGMNFGTELEQNSFAKLVMQNTNLTHLPDAIFSTPAFTLEVDQSRQYTGLGADGRDDPAGSAISINGVGLVPLVIRDNPDTPGADTNYLQYAGDEHVVLGGTPGDDIIISSEGDDTLYGDEGNDRLEGGFGNDVILGGDGDDIIQDMGGDDNLQGGDGNDVIHAGNMEAGSAAGNLILAGAGKDFIMTVEDISTTFGGLGDDFIYSAKTSLPPTGNEGDDWIEWGTQDGAPGDNFAPFLADDVIGNDIFIGGGGFDEMIGEGGDDIFVGSDAQDKMDGMSGYDWVTYKNDALGVTADLGIAIFGGVGETGQHIAPPFAASPSSILDRFAEVEGLSGTAFTDILRGDNVDPTTILNHGGATGGALTNLALIDGLEELLNAAGIPTTGAAPESGFVGGNIILGGAGGDIIEGRGGDDLIDGDKWLNVRISVRENTDGTGAEIASFDSMTEMFSLMINGVYNPGQLVAVREIKDSGSGFDTAVFSGNRVDYSVIIDDNGTLFDFSDDIVIVTDNVVGRDGTDRLTNIERLQFADQVNTLVPFLDNEPVGLLAILDAETNAPENAPTEGQLLRASIAGVTDADNISATNPTGAITDNVFYTWQVETVPGSGVFEDIIILPAGDLAFQSADSTTLRVTPDLAGLSLRVRAIFVDDNGVPEIVFSNPTAPVIDVPDAPPATAVAAGPEITEGGDGIRLIRSDLDFILQQIKIAEQHSAGVDLLSLLPNIRSASGLRTVDGSFNNLIDFEGIDQTDFGAADTVFPRVTDPIFRDDQDGDSIALGPPPAPVLTNTDYASSGNVVDADPRIISNLIVDQTANNPAAIAAALRGAGSEDIAGDTAAFLAALQAIEDAEAEAVANLAAAAADLAAAEAAIAPAEQAVSDAQAGLDAAEAADAVAQDELAAALAEQAAAAQALTDALLAVPPEENPATDPAVLAALADLDAAADVTAAAQAAKDATAAEVVTAGETLAGAQAGLVEAQNDVVEAQQAYDTALASDPGVAAAQGAFDQLVEDLGLNIVASPGLDGQFGTDDDTDVFLIENVSPDVGLSAPFNAWMTFFGQFFDHGLDLVTKGGSGTVFIPLEPDDPLYDPGPDGVAGTADDAPTNFMVLTRATNLPGADGILGTADDIHEHENTTSPFVDQNQTYTSHPSHQVFLRAYTLGADNAPHATGRLITNRDLGDDGVFGTADDTEIGGMATWATVKAQARDVLGINLTDADVENVPLLATDEYGNFIRGPNGFPQVVMQTAGTDGIFGTSDDGTALVEGDPEAPIDLSHAVRTGHQFLIDIAHNAVPVFDAGGNLAPDADDVAGNPVAFNPFTGANTEYDNELLDAHYIAGDGRANENIGLTAVHAIFHSEHNRLVEQTKDTVLAAAQAGDIAFLNEWLLAPVAGLPADLSTLQWNGERLFQVAKFGTEMQYQHLVFEEFARTIQPNIDLFFAPTQVYDVNLDASIVAEFAHTVYRFGHSMLTETVDRYDANFQSVDGGEQLGLIEAFLNPLAYAASGATPEEATSAIIRGVTREVGNEIDEFVTEALRNNLLGLPLDLAAINIARGRDVGIPTLNAVRHQVYEQTADSQLRPYRSWADLLQHLKHPESLINFIAAYGTHEAITSATTLDGMRAAALALVLGDGDDSDGVTIDGITYFDRLDFLNSTGDWANDSALHTAKDLDGVTTTGLGNVDLWIGGLAEEIMPFGGMLGSTFNFIFENQLEKLQDGDRFYYLERTAGLSFNAELESNSFAKLIMANTDAIHLPAVVFLTPALTLEVDPSKQFTGLGTDGRADPDSGDPLAPIVIRDNPATPGADTNYLRYAGEDHVVLGGTDPGDAFNPSGNDILIASEGDDTIWGDGGDDTIDGGYGNDNLRGGAGDDIITDLGGDDNIQGGDGNDVIHGGNGVNLIIGGFGNDFIVTGEDANESFGGGGNDFIIGTKADEQNMGNEGDDWFEFGAFDGQPGDNFDPLGNDPIAGNDIFIGGGENDKFNAEGGDDIMAGKVGLGDRYIGASGFDWAIFKFDTLGVTIDLGVNRFFDQPVVPGSGASVLTRFDFVEGLSGSHFGDALYGDDADATTLPTAGAQGSILTNIALIDGLQDFLDDLLGGPVTFFDGGNIILGGGGGDLIEGRGGDDLIDGDAWLNVRISVRENTDGTGAEIATFDTATEMIPLMLAGTYNPGQLVAVREIKFSDDPSTDTAKFSGALIDAGADGLLGTPDDIQQYTIAVNGVITAIEDLTGIGAEDVVTVTDTVGTDGTDSLRHIERLQFSDQTIVLNGTNNGPVGLLAISNPSPVEDEPLTVSIAGVTDADNVATGGAIPAPVAYFWQIETNPGSGVFEDMVTDFTAGEVARVTGPTFTPGDGESGLRLRVRAVYKDANGVLEEVFSAPTAPVVNVNDAPVGTVLISDTTPTETLPLTASIAFTDADGLTAAVFAFQWQQSDIGGGGAFTDIPGAITQFFTPGVDQVDRQLRVVVSYTDDLGTAETVISSPTTVVGDFFTGNGAADIFDGTEGADIALGNGGGDTLTGNGGGDSLDGGGGRDFIDGGAGIDTILGGGGSDTLNGGDAGDLIDGGAGIDMINGDAGNDTIVGGAGADVINAGAGDDVITYVMGDGADAVFGDAGADTLSIRGTAGSDMLNVVFDGSALTTFENGTIDSVESVLADLLGGIDTLSYGGAATSSVSVDLTAHTASGFASVTGIENVIGGVGDDQLAGDLFANVLNGGAGSDTLSGGLGEDTLIGGGGNDTVSYAGETDAMFVSLASGSARRGSALAVPEDVLASLENVIGGTGNDGITGNNAANLLDGGAGNDTLDGGSGSDTLVGGLGDDEIVGGAGTDLLMGGAGNDSISYTFGDGVDSVIDGGDDSDSLSITGTAANNALTVNWDGTSLTSFTGAAILTGIEDVSADLLDGTDTLNYGTTTADVVVNLTTGTASGFSTIAGVENVMGGSGNDTLTGDDAVANMLAGGAGDDTYFVGAGDSVAESAGNGTDTVNSSASFSLGANIENLTLTGDADIDGSGNGLANSLLGNSGNNVLGGGGGADTLDGGDGNDTLNGNGGDDVLIGGLGDDTMNGGGGNDTFVFAPGFGADIINGFDANPGGSGQDILDISAYGFTPADIGTSVTITDLGSDTLVTIGADTITLVGVTGNGANVITVDDFRFI